MATIAIDNGSMLPGNVVLQSAQTGNSDSTNVVDRGALRTSGVLTITSTVGATPTVTVALLCSVDAVNWVALPYQTPAAPATIVSTALAAITTATTSVYWIPPSYGWRYLKLNMSANTNVTLTTTYNQSPGWSA